MLLLLPAFHEQMHAQKVEVEVQNHTLDALEKDAIERCLKKHNNNQSQAAKELGITLRQIGYKIKKYGI